MSKTLKANNSVLLKVNGIVQGLGFRPFVFNLAKINGLNGYIRNTGFGVEILFQGQKESVSKAINAIDKSKFNLKLSKKKILAKQYKSFKILKSSTTKITSDFPSDLAICETCKKELFDKKNRRYKYPFINCVKCGPRFSIIKKLPYDRHNTTMSKFKMCKDCQHEYDNPLNRRFHAQPNACHKCGPQIKLYSNKKKFLSKENNALNDAIKFLKKGKILAIKSIGGYHLVCDASNIAAINFLRKRKNRPFKPFAIMANLNDIKKICLINKFEIKELLSKKAPIVLLNKKNKNKFTEAVAPNNNTLGMMVPYTPLQCLLTREIPFLVMTSANLSDEPISITEKEAFKNLHSIADYFLVNDREIVNRSDDSIVRFLQNSNEKIVLRRSRGFVPDAIEVDIKENIFAAGGDLKNNFCLTRKNKAYLSQYIGDLENNRNLKFYNETIDKFKKFLNIKPDKYVCDSHPEYYSSLKWINSKKTLKTPHHYAHIASVIAENNIKGNVIGFAFDGNGYGEDGNMWGGEIVLFKNKKFQRLSNFDYFKLPGGDLATTNIWHIAVSLLHKYNKDEYIKNLFKKHNYKPILAMLNSNINSPKTSSVGRLFDAVCALLNIKHTVTFEAEAAVALESLIKKPSNAYYKFTINENVINVEKVIEGILKDIDMKIPASSISVKFHNTICKIIVISSKFYSKKYKTKNIVLSGGVFQNIYILNKTKKELEKNNIKVFFNKKVSVNDGGIALGQAYLRSIKMI